MIAAGIEYGCLSTGETYIFLQTRHGDPENVYPLLAEAKVDIKLEKDGFGDVIFVAKNAFEALLITATMGLKLVVRHTIPNPKNWPDGYTYSPSCQ